MLAVEIPNINEKIREEKKLLMSYAHATGIVGTLENSFGFVKKRKIMVIFQEPDSVYKKKIWSNCPVCFY